MNESFRSEEIEQAHVMKALGINWQPQVGHYVYDTARVVQKPSPFQDGVYFILNYDFFMGLIGGIDKFKEVMTWLPTWEDSRSILVSLGITDAELSERLVSDSAFDGARERLAAYRLIVSLLQQRCSHDRITTSNIEVKLNPQLNESLNA